MSTDDTRGTWYTPGDKPAGEPNLYVNPPYQPASGTGAFLVEASQEVKP